MEHLSHNEFVSKKRCELRELANKLINNDIDVIDGCRHIVDIFNQIDFPESDTYFYFVGIVSQTDDIPRGTYRDLCAPLFLKKKDEEATDFIRQIKSNLIKNCYELITALKNQDNECP